MNEMNDELAEYIGLKAKCLELQTKLPILFNEICIRYGLDKIKSRSGEWDDYACSSGEPHFLLAELSYRLDSVKLWKCTPSGFSLIATICSFNEFEAKLKELTQE